MVNRFHVYIWIVELQREQQRNEDDKKPNPVFTELLNEYKEIVE